MSQDVAFRITVDDETHAKFLEPHLDQDSNTFRRKLVDIAWEAKEMLDEVGTTKTIRIHHEESGLTFRAVYDNGGTALRWLTERDNEVHTKLNDALNKAYIRHEAMSSPTTS